MALLPARRVSTGRLAPRTRWRLYQGTVVVGWLTTAWLLTIALGDWVSLDVWLVVSIWMICAMMLAPITNRLLRTPVTVFERDVDPSHRALPVALRPALRDVLMDARTLRLTLDSSCVDLDTVSTDLWRWVRDIEALSEMDATILREHGLDVEPIRQALVGREDERPDRAARESTRALVVQWLERFDDQLSAYRDGLYR